MNTPRAPRPGAPGGAGGSVLRRSGPTESIWLRILTRCIAATAAALALAAVVALIVTGKGAVLSVLLAWLVVAGFFGISLLIGHLVGRDNPSGALGVFALAYAVKVIGFAAVLFLLGAPDWLERNWFFGSAVGTVVLWQAVEMYVFARARHQLYADSPSMNPTDNEHA
jgi:ATP synthase protein I